MLYDKAFLTDYHDGIKNLTTLMERHGIPKEIINAMIESRYFSDFVPFNENNIIPMPLYDGQLIFDGYIDGCDINCSINSLLVFEDFFNYVNKFRETGKTYSNKRYPRFNAEVHNVSEISSLLSEIKTSLPYLHDKIVFRGVTMKYYLKRPFPNPVYSLDDGLEYNLIPSFYRHYADKDSRLVKQFNNRLEVLRNQYIGEAGGMLQHYGVSTIDLDVTYDIMVALFFSLNKLVKDENGGYDYVPLRREEFRNAVIYVLGVDIRQQMSDFKFENIALPSSHKNVLALRPQRQDCSSLPANRICMNKAASEVIAVITFAEDFVLPENIPDKKYLFPSPEEDEAFAYLLGISAAPRKGNSSIFEQLMKYDSGEESIIKNDYDYREGRMKLVIQELLHDTGSEIMKFSFHYE